MLPLLKIYQVRSIFLGVKYCTSAKRPMKKIKEKGPVHHEIEFC